MANQKNIDPYKIKKGEVRNPKGKPKGTLNAKTILKQLLDAQIDDDEIGPTNKPRKITGFEKLMRKLIRMGNEGDIKAIREILDRVEGKPIAKQEITGVDGGPLKVENDISISELDSKLAKYIDKGKNS